MTGHRTWMRRVAAVGVVLTACSVTGAASASASSSQAAQDDLLGLNRLVGGVTAALTGPQEEASAAGQTQSAAPAARTDEGLSGTVEELPLLGPVLAPVVEELPLLGSSDAPAAPAIPAPVARANPAPTKPAPLENAGKADSAQRPISRPEMSPVGSTWTAPRNVGTSREPSPASGGGVSGAAADVVRSVSALLPESATGKAGVGAAAVALIVLGGVAVAGAAGAAGAAGRRQLVGGAW